MQVHIQNDGPVTIQLETPNLPPPKEVHTHSCRLPLLQIMQTNPLTLPLAPPLHSLSIPLFVHPMHPPLSPAEAAEPSKEKGHGEQ